MSDITVIGKESYFNENSTFYKNVTVYGNINVEEQSTFGIVTATEFRGSGANLTGIQPFPAGTLMLFQQTSAPTGWTKQTTHNDKTLRVVSGSASSGGSTAFTTVFASRTPSGSVTMNNAAFTLTTNEMPAHSHPTTVTGLNLHVYGSVNSGRATSGGTDGVVNFSMSNTGGGASHTHANTASFSGSSMDFDVQYVDLIIASKD